MDKTLVVVESPAKAKTIKKYLGAGYEVKASVGHIKDLPQKELGVRVNEGFIPEYQVITGKEKLIKELSAAAQKAARVFLATDPDREGEAIAWHLREELKKPAQSVFRVLFNELTEKTIKEAIAHPSRLDENKYNAQQARRILDRIVGYQISPLLWDKVQYGLSAGRVQSVALRLIVDRQKQIDTFVPQEYWTITATLAAGSPPPFEAKLIEDDGEKIEILTAATAARLTARAREHPFEVVDVKHRERSRKPAPPFITSTLQQEGSRKLRMTSSRTMRIAQQLYEGIELGDAGAVGLITYMRTDSPRIAPEALAAVRGYIQSKYGPEYLPERPHTYKGRKTAQEAHEAIRPTSMDLPPEKVARFLDKAQIALYTLIWNRFVASQTAAAVFDLTTANIQSGKLLFRVTGSVMKFDGFIRIYSQDKDEETAQDNGDKEDAGRLLPPLKAGDRQVLEKLLPRQHFTQPPAAFNEASLIKELEEQGIGRPSTYAETVSTIQKRKYVELQDKKFRPTLLGRIIAGLLKDSFPKLLNTRFTAEMESFLDLVEEGKASWTETLQDFYEPFQSDLQKAKKTMKNVKREGIPTQAACPECGAPLLVRSGRYGLFIGCSAYPACAYTQKIAEDTVPSAEPIPTDQKCPQCGAPMVIRSGRTGQFLSCSRYPECRAASPLTTGVSCPKCGIGELAQRRTKKGKTFYSCSRYPECDYSLWYKPVSVACPNPECDSAIMEERGGKNQQVFLQCPKCKTKLANEAA
ncbi:MAG: type I DNA topoisomerase [Desulfomonilaceae bacterium]